MELVYYTIGFNSKYLDLLYISILSLRNLNTQDVLVICDESLVEQCNDTLKSFHNVIVSPCKDSINAMDSSMKKLLIFDYDIEKYDKIMFIDSDILVDINTKDLFDKFIEDNRLYAFSEDRDLVSHEKSFYSLLNYTDEELTFLKNNRIYVFNCGLFAFLNTPVMKQHFQNIRDMIKDYKGEYYYEQSFMNVYFNTRNLVDTKVFNNSNCSMLVDMRNIIPLFVLPWTVNKYRNRFIHFNGTTNGVEFKKKEMLLWKTKFRI